MELREKTVACHGAKFIPLLFWYDGTHIARRSSYIDLVFECDNPSPVGQFIEDNFSQKVMTLLREDFDKWSRVYSLYIFQPFEEETALIYHLDGRKYKTDQSRKEMGWRKNAGTDSLS